MAMRQSHPAKLPPGPGGHPIFSSLQEFSADPIAYASKYAPQYDGLIQIGSWPYRTYLLTDLEGIKHVLQGNQRNYHKSRGYKEMRPMLGNGLVTSEGDFWMKQRRLMQPAFHKKAIAGFGQVMSSAASRLLDRLDEQCKTESEINISHEMGRTTMEIVAESILGSDIEGDLYALSDDLELANRDANRRILTPFTLPMWWPTPHNRKVKSALAGIDRVINQIIQQRRSTFDPDHIPEKADLLHMLLAARDDENQGMSDKQLRDEIATTFIAGHETTATAMAWTLYLLARNPSVLEKLQNEVDELGKDPGLEDLPRLQYTQWVAAEGLRYYPPAWIIGRMAVEEDEILGYRIPQNTNILIPTIYLHHKAEYWDNPEEFRPERHGEKKTKDLPKYAYFPFGGGPRFCIGINFAMMEMHLLLPTIIRHFDLQASGQELKMDPLITLHPKSGIKLNMQPR